MVNYNTDKGVDYVNIGPAAAELMKRNDIASFILGRPLSVSYDVKVASRNSEYDPIENPNRYFDVDKTDDLASAIEAELEPSNFGVPDEVQVVNGEGVYRVYLK